MPRVPTALGVSATTRRRTAFAASTPPRAPLPARADGAMLRTSLRSTRPTACSSSSTRPPKYPSSPAGGDRARQAHRKGRSEAKEKLINSNLRLVIKFARRYQGHGLPMGDLVQEAMLGLIRAAEKFDWRRGCKFSTYAVLWIKQSIQRGLDNTGRAVKSLPTSRSASGRSTASRPSWRSSSIASRLTRRSPSARNCRSTRSWRPAT